MESEGRKFAHAVAVDCMKKPELIFFDPLIGQFTFPNYANFELWWKTCWQQRHKDEDEENAWSSIRENGSARIEGMYKNPDK